MKNLLIGLLLVICVILTVVIYSTPSEVISVTDVENVSDNQFKTISIRLAKQYGMQYAPVYIMEKMGLLDKYLPGAKIEWNSFGGGAAITEALVGNHLDVGFMGMPPAIVAWDKGSNIKIASGISVPPFGLMVKEERIKSITDLKSTDKIAVPGVGSTQQILLSIAAKKFLGDARNLDTNIVTMANPDAFSSLISGTDIVGHFTTMPFLEKERKEGFRNILSGKEAYGDASIICVASKDFYNNNKIAYAALMMALSEAIDLINQQDPKVLNIISEVEKISIDDAKAYLDWEGTNYTTNIYGLLGLATYMKEAGYIKKQPTLQDLLWDNARAMIGKRTGEESLIEAALGK